MNAIECKNREEWLEARKGLITASDAAAALGLSPFKSPLQLYAEKIGAADGPDETLRMKRGRRFQRLVGQEFAEDTGRTVTEAPEYTIFVHPDVRSVGATLDFDQVDGEKGAGVVEAKVSGKPWVEEPPDYYQVQLQVQLSVVGKTWGTLVALQGIFAPLVWADQELNEKFVKRALGKLDEFMWRVGHRRPPEVVVQDRAVASTSEALRALYKQDSGATIALPPGTMELADEIEALTTQEGLLKKQIAARKNVIKAALGEATGGLLPDGSAYTWTTAPVKGYAVAATTRRTLRRVGAK
jgi:putative phage-type endonuclease